MCCWRGSPLQVSPCEAVVAVSFTPAQFSTLAVRCCSKDQAHQPLLPSAWQSQWPSEERSHGPCAAACFNTTPQTAPAWTCRVGMWMPHPGWSRSQWWGYVPAFLSLITVSIKRLWQRRRRVLLLCWEDSKWRDFLGNGSSGGALYSLQSVGCSRSGQERIHMYPLIYVFPLCSLLDCFLPAFVNLAGVETVKTTEHYQPRMLESLLTLMALLWQFAWWNMCGGLQATPQRCWGSVAVPFFLAPEQQQQSVAGCSCTAHGRAGSGFPHLHPRLLTAGEGTGKGGITVDPTGHSGWKFQCCQRNTAACSAQPVRARQGNMRVEWGRRWSQRWTQNSVLFPTCSDLES